MKRHKAEKAIKLYDEIDRLKKIRDSGAFYIKYWKEGQKYELVDSFSDKAVIFIKNEAKKEISRLKKEIASL